MKTNLIKEDLVVRPNMKVILNEWDPEYNGGIYKKEVESTLTKDILDRMSELQYKLFADKSQSLLIILQGVDTSGKDSTIRHVMGAFNPQSCRVVSFKAPNDEELSHDYLWRIHKVTPAKGEIVIFNRSHYEDVIEARVQRLITEAVWSERYRQINEFERYLYENNIKTIKLFLHISKDEQKKRLEDRIKDPSKHWKFSESDIIQRKYWDQYIIAYEDVLSKCSTSWALWYIIPANTKWFRNFAIANIIVKSLEDMKLRFPKPKIDLSKVVVDD